MAQSRGYDLAQLGGGVSIDPGTNTDAGSDVDGLWVDCGDVQGPVQAVCSVGDATGSPTAQSINFELWEADDSSGTNEQKVSNQSEVTLTADATQGILSGHSTKPYCSVKVIAADSSFTGGTSPTIDTGANILFEQRQS